MPFDLNACFLNTLLPLSSCHAIQQVQFSDDFLVNKLDVAHFMTDDQQKNAGLYKKVDLRAKRKKSGEE